MNEFKYQFVNIILLGLLGTGVYWAFNSIDNGIIYDKAVVVGEEIALEEKNNQEEIVLFDNTKPEIEEPEIIANDETPIASGNSDVIVNLQKLVDSKTTMDSGASGENVGTVQEFLALYFKDKKISIDKDFGPTTKGLVKKFQQKELGGGGGNIGPNTLKAMITWLKK